MRHEKNLREEQEPPELLPTNKHMAENKETPRRESHLVRALLHQKEQKNTALNDRSKTTSRWHASGEHPIPTHPVQHFATVPLTDRHFTLDGDHPQDEDEDAGEAQLAEASTADADADEDGLKLHFRP
jgi:hypothetical protein